MDRYTDHGEPQNLVRDALGALERKLKEGDAFKPRATDSDAFKVEIKFTSKKFSLKAEQVVDESSTTSAPNLILPKTELTAEDRKWLEKLFTDNESRFNLNSNALQDGGEHALVIPKRDNVQIPTLEECLAFMQGPNGFSHEQVDALMAKRVHEKSPILTTYPAGKLFMSSAVPMLDNGTKMLNQCPTYVFDSRQTQFAEDEKQAKWNGKITGWLISIMEGTQNPKGKTGKLGDLINQYLSSRKPGLSLPIPHIYALAMKQSIMERRLLNNSTTWSVLQSLDGEIIKNDRISGGGWSWNPGNYGGVHFLNSSPEADYGYARFPSSAMVFKPLDLKT